MKTYRGSPNTTSTAKGRGLSRLLSRMNLRSLKAFALAKVLRERKQLRRWLILRCIGGSILPAHLHRTGSKIYGGNSGLLTVEDGSGAHIPRSYNAGFEQVMMASASKRYRMLKVTFRAP